MQTLTLKVQDSILDKLMLLLNNFSRDDLEIIESPKAVIQGDYMDILRDRHIKINKNIDIDKITDEINSGIS
jgi:hypothetical protein